MAPELQTSLRKSLEHATQIKCIKPNEGSQKPEPISEPAIFSQCTLAEEIAKLQGVATLKDNFAKEFSNSELRKTHQRAGQKIKIAEEHGKELDKKDV